MEMIQQIRNTRTWFLVTGLIAVVTPLWSQHHPAAFVWMDETGSGRQQTVLFRRSFELMERPEKAEIHLFADSRYHIYVNGIHLNFGPSRFYPANPEYDTYDMAPFLDEGMNVVAVEVLSNGTLTFQVPLSRGGFIAWGAAEGNAERHTFETPGAWKMYVPNAFDSEAIRFSFACGPMEIFDGRKQPAGWNLPGFDVKDWGSPVPHADQHYWGALTPRTIPKLTQDEVLPIELLGIYPESREEEYYSFFIKTPDDTREQYGSGKQMYACTYIYSPVDQQIDAGLWWGRHYLNGQGPLQVSGTERGNPVRQNRILDLKEGWNFLFIDYVAIWGGWDFYLAVPSEAGLVLSPDKNREGGPFILTAGPFKEGVAIFDQEQDVQRSPQEVIQDEGYGWVPRENLVRGSNPARDLVWKKAALDQNLKKDDYRIAGFEVQEPLLLIYDMGSKQLGRIFFEADAHPGSIVDFGWTEDLNSLGLPYLYKRLQVNSGARFITSEGRRRYETFKPYGVRYLVVRVDPGMKPFHLHNVGMVSQVYPFEKKGSFTCSNPMLNRIWEMGWRTLRVCSEDSYTDTPFRERGLYAGDALPEYAITLVTSGDSRLLKRSLMLFQEMYRKNLLEGEEEGLNDFVLKTLLLLHWYDLATGDREFLERLYPNYRSLMRHILERKNDAGYYSTERVFIEWTRIDKSADLTAYQVLVARSFSIMAGWASQLGYNADASLFSSEAGRLKRLISEHFWDPRNNAFRDGFREGVPIDHHYPISGVYPLLFGVCSEEQERQVLDMLDRELRDIGEESRNRKISPYGSFYLFGSLYQAGRADIAERFMLQYWSRMIHQGDDTSWENFDIGSEDGGGQGTASHAWSGHPTYFLSTEALGVQLGFQGELDREEILISPQSETLEWARGRVPHPSGMVGVEWQIKGNRLVMNLTVPQGVPYRVVPRGRLAALTLDLNVKIEN